MEKARFIAVSLTALLGLAACSDAGMNLAKDAVKEAAKQATPASGTPSSPVAPASGAPASPTASASAGGQVQVSANDYYPMALGKKWVYTITTTAPNLPAGFTLPPAEFSREVIAATSTTFTVRTTMTPPGQSKDLIYTVNANGTITLNGQSEQGDEPPPANLSEGQSWTSASGYKTTVLAMNDAVTVPAGSYSAVKVLTEGSQAKSTAWLVKGIGLIKSESLSAGTTSTLVLKSYQ